MSIDNPYSPPQTEVSDPVNDVPNSLRESPRSNGIGHGWTWLSAGFRLFKASPLIWIVNLVLFVLIMFLLTFIPFLGSVVQTIISPALTGGLMAGCREQDQGQPLTVEHLFRGFSERPGALLGIGAISLVASVLVFGGAFALSGLGMATFMALQGGQMDPQQMQQLGPAILMAFLLGMALFMPLMMLIWFAPPLLTLNKEIGILRAMKLSFIGCLKNILPFLLYGLIGLLLMIVASIPLGLGWLVLGPMAFASIYTSYKDIFVE